MAELKWIKLLVDFFDDEKILLIESLPDADSIIIIWIKLLTLAGKQNNNGVLQKNNIKYDVEMLSKIFKRPSDIVKKAMDLFCEYGMVEYNYKTYMILNWDKHQSLDKMEKYKEQNRLRTERYRQKQKQQARENTPENDVAKKELNDIINSIYKKGGK
jgi:predicted phage replisome organizer